MPWDQWCPDCGAPLAGGMADGDRMDQEMKAFDDKMRGKLMKCGDGDCGVVYDYDTWKKLNEDEVKKSGKEIIELYA